MFSFYDLDTGSFIVLVTRPPTVSELQAALDAEDFVSRLVVSPVEPVEVQSGTPPLYEWRGRLDGKDVAFRIGVTRPEKLPKSVLEDAPDAQAWPVVLWSANSGEPAIVGSGAMAIYSWAAATGGATLSGSPRRITQPPNNRIAIDVVLSHALGNWDKMRARYGDLGPDTSPRGGQPMDIRTRVFR